MSPSYIMGLVNCKEVQLWQNVVYVEKVHILERKSAILIEDLTKCGNLILNL